MKFHRLQDHELYRKVRDVGLTKVLPYEQLRRRVRLVLRHSDVSMYSVEQYTNLLSMLQTWILIKKPYYRLWPGFIEQVRAMNMDTLKLSDVDMRNTFMLNDLLPGMSHDVQDHSFNRETSDFTLTVSIEFPDDPSSDCWIDSGEYGVRVQNNLFVCDVASRRIDSVLTGYALGHHPGMDGGPVDREPVANVSSLDLSSEETFLEMEQSIYSTLKTKKERDITERRMVHYSMNMKLVIVLLMLSREESGLFDRIVLSKDKKRYAEGSDPALIAKLEQKAMRNGVFGWDVGKDIPTKQQLEDADITTSGMRPHYRRGTFGLRWTGQGRKVPKITWIKGSFVNKNKLSNVPEGFYGD